MTLRVWLMLVCLIAFNGCYTQIRPPGVQKDRGVDAPLPPSDVSVQRFEYYHHTHYDYCDPFDLRSVPFYEPGLPNFCARYPSWRRNRLLWEYSCWATVYDPRWRGYLPRILIPQVVYASAVRPPVTVREDWIEQPNPRPRIRHTGLSSPPVSASTVRTGTTTTKSTLSTQTTSKSGSTKTQPPPAKKEDEDKSEKREEKRTTQRRRGGMR